MSTYVNPELYWTFNSVQLSRWWPGKKT